MRMSEMVKEVEISSLFGKGDADIGKGDADKKLRNLFN